MVTNCQKNKHKRAKKTQKLLKWPKNGQKQPNMAKKCLKCLGRWSKWVGIQTPNFLTKYGEKLAENGQKWLKMAQNGLKCLGKWCKWVQEYQHQIAWPKMVKYARKFIIKYFLASFQRNQCATWLVVDYQLAPSNLGAPNHCSFFLGLILKKCCGVEPFNEKMANTTNFVGREIMFLGGNWLVAKNPHFHIADPRLLFCILLLIQ